MSSYAVQEFVSSIYFWAAAKEIKIRWLVKWNGIQAPEYIKSIYCVRQAVGGGVHLVWIGGIVVILTLVAIIKRYEIRMVLFLSGLLMTILSGKWLAAFDAFSAAMVNSGLVPVICTVMGYAYVMKLTKCELHLVNLSAAFLTRCRRVLIPGTVLITFAVNIALPSAAGCAAAVGVILIPALLSAGIHPAIAASAVLAGTWGSAFNPGTVHNPFIAKLAGVDVMSVIAGLSAAALAGAVVVAVSLTAVAVLRKEDQGHDATGMIKSCDENFKVDLVKAIAPVIPLALVVAGSEQVGLLPELSVVQAMIIGAILAFTITLREAQEISKKFFAGMGEAYGSIIGIISAAAVFTKGMEMIGLTGALISFMKQSEGIARLAATFGPFVLAVLSGSGDAATLAFNGTVTPYAKQFGFEVAQLGSQAFLAGALGRSMSPLAGAAIVCATLAGVNPVEIAKRNAPGMIVAALVTMVILL
jgi:DcuC family C4-dicarboxylate transporter